MNHGTRLALSTLLVTLLASSASAELFLADKVAALPGWPQGPFVRLGDGRILTVDLKHSALVSSDEGKTWTEQSILDGEKFELRPERALVRTRKGTVILAFMNERENKFGWNKETFDAPAARRPTYVMRSPDDGRTWEAPQLLHEDYTGAIRDMIETTGGDVVFTSMKMQHNPGRHSVLTYRSTDQGQTWQSSNVLDRGGVGHHGGLSEPTVVERRDGRLWLVIRSNWGTFYQADSSDRGLSWSDLRPTTIAASSAPGLIKRLASGRLMLLWNQPYPQGQTSFPMTGGDKQWSETPVSNHRLELSLALSEDDGQTWSKPRVIAKTDKRWCSYPYLFEPQPGVLWITTMQGDLRATLREADFVESK